MESVGEFSEKESSHVRRKLKDMKIKLDELLQQKNLVDDEMKEIDKEIKIVNLSFEDDKVDAVVHQKSENIIKELQYLSNERELLGKQQENIEVKCKEINKHIQENIENKLSTIQEDLESLQRERKEIVSEDKEVEEKNQQILKESNEIESEMCYLSNMRNQINQDEYEIYSLMRKISEERSKLIMEDELLNKHYEFIIKDLTEVCERRNETMLKLQIDELNENDKNQILDEDLSLAVKQRGLEDQFENWKKEKKQNLKNHEKLDEFNENIQNKYEIVKNKIVNIQEKCQELSNLSNKLKEDYENNQKTKRVLVERFSENDHHLTSLIEKINSHQKEQNVESSTLFEQFQKLNEEKEIILDKNLEISSNMEVLNNQMQNLLVDEKEKKTCLQKNEEVFVVYLLALKY